MSNKSAKERLIKLYGAECFIDKLHLRKDPQRHYTSVGEYYRMKQLTYHHIKMKKDGGRATVENGALLSTENHEWFHRQPKKEQEEMNRAFQEYKKCKIVHEDFESPIEVRFREISIDKKGKLERRKDKNEMQKLKKDWEDR